MASGRALKLNNNVVILKEKVIFAVFVVRSVNDSPVC